MAKRRKPFGVWVQLQDGNAWMYCAEKTLSDAMLTARTLRGDSPLFPYYRVWVAGVDVQAYAHRTR